MHNIVLFAERVAAPSSQRDEKEEVRFSGQERTFVNRVLPPSRAAESAALILRGPPRLLRPPPPPLPSPVTSSIQTAPEATGFCGAAQPARASQMHTRVSSRMSVSSFLGEPARMHARP